MSVDIRLDFSLYSLVPDWKWVARPHFIVEEDWSQENVQAFISNMLFYAILCYFLLFWAIFGSEIKIMAKRI